MSWGVFIGTPGSKPNRESICDRLCRSYCRYGDCQTQKRVLTDSFLSAGTFFCTRTVLFFLSMCF